MSPRRRLAAAALLVAGCALGASEHGTGTRAPSAPAAGLWSHTFVAAPGGKVVAVGFSRTPPAVAVVRYLPSGRLDPTFARTTLGEFGAGKLDALASAADSSGRIVVAACRQPDCWGYAVTGRLLPNGTVDATFGNGGVVRTHVAGAELEPRAIALAADGGVAVAGEAEVASARHLFVARFSKDGIPIRSFGENGVLVSPVLGPAGAVAFAEGGHVLVAGTGYVVRLSPDGTLDVRFGKAGIAAVPALLRAEDLLVDRRGRVVAAGSAHPRHEPVLALARLRRDGTLDRSFGRTGVVRDRRPRDHWGAVEDLVPVEAGVLAVGWATRGGRDPRTRRYRIVVVRLDERGRFVRRFGHGGRVTFEGFEAQGRAGFRRGRGLLVVGPDDDLRPAVVRFARLRVR